MDYRQDEVAMVYCLPHTLGIRRPYCKVQGSLIKSVADDLLELDGLRDFDPQALTIVHNRFFPEIYRYARYRLGDPETAEDVAGQVFLNLVEALKAGGGPRTSLRGWLIGMASNLINDHFRKAYQQRVEVLHENVQVDGPDPSSQAERRERLEAVRVALAELTPEQQHVLALRFGNDYSVKETAQLLEKQPNAIKALQFRALRTLRKKMEETR